MREMTLRDTKATQTDRIAIRINSHNSEFIMLTEGFLEPVELSLGSGGRKVVTVHGDRYLPLQVVEYAW